ncbi:RagB/SusD family nutrient uptake outer membrane protein [Pedobacter flavus]|uniref:RagB/SusD family nutrient uptake outer membrane protein n=1 Tax=Pedobacter flavus TaxID=3113906 RepID=A0ABU7H2S4_9SPHI|nr:RagB/SusD family nutrient uptake outer membrane protein [Pedobacter sp. VNH31]MEE1885627.1 RagB/SusD family nutrient uptake outer membrane protein [Pedobacter sp. VNH31]
MKKIIAFIAIVVFFTNCKKTDLQLDDPNSPTPAGSLATVKGVEQFALGMWAKLYSGNNLLVHSMNMHSFMGDEQWTSAGNFGWRYVNQVDKITLPPPYNTVVPGVLVIDQPTQLKALNNLAATNGSQTNALVYEWNMAYLVNGQANFLLAAVENPNITLSASKKATLMAWAYWWKGFAYSRIGSMYIAGVINNKTDGSTDSQYRTRQEMITEANANFDKAIALLAPLAANDSEYNNTLNAIVPNFNKPTPNVTITPQMWVRGINTYKARNLLVNKKVTELTAGDLTSLRTLANAGMVEGDITFLLGISAIAGEGISPNNQQHILLWNSHANNPGWMYPSERWVQDFKPGDQRMVKGVSVLPTPEVNRSARGIQFGTRYFFTAIQNGGYWSTNARTGFANFAGSWEENALMLAEADIRTNQIEAGLARIDRVRAANGAGLAATVGTGLNQAQALEELRKERRIGLTLKGLAFYDARRWGVITKASAGGGRANANVLVPNSMIGATPNGGFTVLPTFMDYNYMDYWDVPVTEFSFNTPSSSSPAIAN